MLPFLKKDYMPRIYTDTFWNLRSIMVNKSFNAWGVVFNGSMTESNDYFEPRVWENFIRPIWTNYRTCFLNYQRRIAVDAGIGYFFVKETIGGNGIMMLRFGFESVTACLLSKNGIKVFKTIVRALLLSLDSHRKFRWNNFRE